MPKITEPKNPGTVLQSFLDEYGITPFFLSKQINMSNATVLNIVKGTAKVTIQTALRLARYFGNPPMFWIDLQTASEINDLCNDKEFLSELRNIPKAQKPAARAKTAAKSKTAQRKTDTLAEKRKKAAKVPGAKAAKGKKAGKPAKK